MDVTNEDWEGTDEKDRAEEQEARMGRRRGWD